MAEKFNAKRKRKRRLPTGAAEAAEGLSWVALSNGPVMELETSRLMPVYKLKGKPWGSCLTWTALAQLSFLTNGRVVRGGRQVGRWFYAFDRGSSLPRDGKKPLFTVRPDKLHDIVRWWRHLERLSAHVSYAQERLQQAREEVVACFPEGEGQIVIPFVSADNNKADSVDEEFLHTLTYKRDSSYLQLSVHSVRRSDFFKPEGPSDLHALAAVYKERIVGVNGAIGRRYIQRERWLHEWWGKRSRVHTMLVALLTSRLPQAQRGTSRAYAPEISSAVVQIEQDRLHFAWVEISRSQYGCWLLVHVDRAGRQPPFELTFKGEITHHVRTGTPT